MLESLLIKLQAFRIPTQTLSCEICQIFKNSSFYRTTPVAAIYYMLEQKVSIGMRGMRKKLNTFMLQLPIYYIYLYWGKCGHCNNEAREIDCLCCRKVDTVLRLKSWSMRKHLAMLLLWVTVRLLVTRVSFI